MVESATERAKQLGLTESNPTLDRANRLGLTDQNNEREDGGTLQFVDNVVRMLAQGVTLNFADEFAAFMRSKTDDVSFDDALLQERARDVGFRQESPVVATGAEIAGAIASPVARFAMPARGQPLLAQSIKAGAAGAGVGAVSGFGSGEGDLTDRGKSAGVGAAGGLVLGAATPAVVKVAGHGLQKLGRVIFGKLGPKNEAARKVLEALRRDKISAADAVDRLKKLGPEAGIADVGEANTTGLARAVTSVPGEARVAGEKFLKGRQLTQGQRVVTAARKGFNEFRKFATSADDLMEARAAAAGPKYDEAYAKAIPLTDELAEILKTDAGKRALGRAARIASNEGATLPKIFGADGNITTAPDMRSWDIIKRAMDSVLNTHRNQLTGKLDLSDPLTFSVNEVRKRMVAELDKINPVYGEARAIFAGPSQALDGMQRGRSFLKGDADFTVKQIEGMSPTDRDFFRLGVIRGIEDVIEGTRDITDVTGRLFGSKAMRDKLMAVFPNIRSVRSSTFQRQPGTKVSGTPPARGESEVFKQFKAFMQAEAKMAQTRQAVLGGSPTARIQAEQADLSRPAGVVADLALGRPEAAVSALARSVAAGVRNKQFSPEVKEEIGRILFTKGNRINQDMVRKLFASEPLKGLGAEGQRQLLGRLVTAAGVGGSAGAKSVVGGRE